MVKLFRQLEVVIYFFQTSLPAHLAEGL